MVVYFLSLFVKQDIQLGIRVNNSAYLQCDTQALGQSATCALRQLSTWTLGHSRHSGTKALEAIYLADSVRSFIILIIEANFSNSKYVKKILNFIT